MFGHLKLNRAIATRYDQLANSFLGMVHLATARYWLKFVHVAWFDHVWEVEAIWRCCRCFLLENVTKKPHQQCFVTI